MVWASRVRLRVGVVGLGRLWEARHKPALAKLRDRFRVTAVYDQVLRRAEIEAGPLGCAAAVGVSELVDRADVDVVHVLTPQWFGLFPVEAACRAKKPVYCALALGGCLDDLERVAPRIEASGIAFMPEFARRFYPATLRLRELLDTTLGRPRLIVGHTRLFGYDRNSSPGPTTQTTPARLMVDPGSYLLDWCSFLFQNEPRSVHGHESRVLPDPHETDPDFESFTAEFEGGGMAQISFGRYHRKAWGDASRFLPPAGFQVYAERGAAWIELPDRVLWSDATGTHEERLPLEPTIGEVLNDQFYRLVTGEPSLAPTIVDALAVACRVAKIGRRREASPDHGG